MIVNNTLSNNKREIILFNRLRQNCFTNNLSITKRGTVLSLLIISASLSLAQTDINKIDNNLTASIRLITDSDNQKKTTAENSAHLNRINSENMKNSLHGNLIGIRSTKQGDSLRGDECEAEWKKSTFFNNQRNLNFKSVYYA